MSDTPETDKSERMAFSSEYMVPTEFARKLERERDEARSQRNALAALLEYIGSAGLMPRHCEDEAKKMLALIFEKEAAK